MSASVPREAARPPAHRIHAGTYLILIRGGLLTPGLANLPGFIVAFVVSLFVGPRGLAA